MTSPLTSLDHNLEARREEEEWWGDCTNTYHEEEKQMVYADLMGLKFYVDHRSPYNIDMSDLNILDIGGGPASLLLKSKWFNTATVVDPAHYPDWVYHRYSDARVDTILERAEDIHTLDLGDMDEVWMYNCLQHTDDPAKIIQNGIEALKPGGKFRVFEWVDTEINVAHPHSLTKDFLDGEFSSLDGEGRLTRLAEHGCYGLSYSGVFTRRNNEAI